MQHFVLKIFYLTGISLLVALVSGVIFLITLNFGPCGLSGDDQGAGGGAPAGMMAIAVTTVAAIGLIAIVILVEIAKFFAIIKGEIAHKFWFWIFSSTVVCSIAFASWFLYIACIAK